MATLLAGAFWGLGGAAAQLLFVWFSFPVIGLVTIRILGAGVILVAILGWKDRPSFSADFLLYALVGIALSTFAYLETIQYSNAVTATLLQFLFLPIVAGYEALTRVLKWTSRWSAAIGLAGVGTFLLVVTFGSRSLGILITPIALAFGLLNAAATALFTIEGGRLARDQDSWQVTAWAFLAGGIATLPFGVVALSDYSLPRTPPDLVLLFGLMGFVVVFGALLAFGLNLIGLRHLPATEVSVLTSVEPISAGIATFVFLDITLSPLQYLGGGLIVLAVTLLGLRQTAPVQSTLPMDS